MQKLAQKTANQLAVQGIISQKDTAVYCYGLEALYSSLLELLTILFLSFFVGNFWQTVLFFAAFIPLRVYAGGYHAKTRLRCYLMSLAVYGVFSMVLLMTPVAWLLPFAWGGSVLSLFIVWLLAPVAHQNHKISLKSRKVYRKTALMICTTEVFIIVLGQSLLQNNTLFFAMLLALLAETISMVVVKFQSNR